ncbi:hypothetical protein KVH22_29920 [Streptomyces olivaceus]|uniref:hypothetical protein n=1 Tax=Streptomyces TaxID=1883 RepID=UPI001CCD0C4D|nr:MULTISPECIES: hypothetical protein [Streptomyces]MBZ6259737.1 hypothetical protein [Streptomyces olivaceus]MCM8550044.1 hypothetical protein [Streptomyces sp. STCH 565 A]
MTPAQVYAVAVIGGLSVILGLALALTLFAGLFLLVSRITDATEKRRRQRDSDTCRAILDLPTTDHPTE